MPFCLLRSRLASAKLVFTPYTGAQLTQIVDQRLQQAGCSDLFKPAAVQWAVRKVREFGTSGFWSWDLQKGLLSGSSPPLS